MVARGVLELRVQQPHQHRVEARLVLDGGQERAPRAPLERAAEAAAAPGLGRRVELVELLQQLAHLGSGLVRERCLRHAVELGERLRVGGFFVLEPETKRLELGDELRVGHGGL